MTPEERAAIRARAAAATPGPWEWEGDAFADQPKACPHGSEWSDHGPNLLSTTATIKAYDDTNMPAPVTMSWGYDKSGMEIKAADAAFIAHAREDIPALLAEVDRLRALTVEAP